MRTDRIAVLCVLAIVLAAVGLGLRAGPGVVGSGRAYAVLGDLPVKHRGRAKPLLRLAIEEARLIHGRPEITVPGVDGGPPVRWEPVAALLDWSARPDFWDDRPWIRVDSPELERRLLAASGRNGEALGRIAPAVLRDARIDSDGRSLTFSSWAGELLARLVGPGLSPVEAEAARVGLRYFHYLSISRHDGPFDWMAIPRPFNDASFRYSRDCFNRALDPDRDLDPLEANAADTLVEYLQGLRERDWALPGEDPVFDQQYVLWLAIRSAWIPIGPLLVARPDELESAGFPGAQAEDFQRAYRALEAAEREAPGDLPEATAVAFLHAARELGSSLGGYPDPSSMARESRQIRFATASRALGAFGLGLVLLLAGLAAGKASAWLHPAGLIAMAAGIGLGLNDLAIGYRIVHLVPSANPGQVAESAAMAAAGLGLLFGLRRRRALVAIAGCSAAILAMLLADDPPTLDSALRLPLPEARINRWLLAHAAPIAAGYGAFAIASVVGLLAIASGKAVDLARVLVGLMLAGVLLLAIGLGAGFAWARVEWDGDWSRDPKLIASLATLGIYLAALIARWAGRLGPTGLAIASIVGIGSVLVLWHGLNYAMHSGRHGYGFSDEGIAWWYVPVVVVVVTAFAIGSLCRFSATPLADDRPGAG